MSAKKILGFSNWSLRTNASICAIYAPSRFPCQLNRALDFSLLFGSNFLKNDRTY
ncbi:hypothetical protein Nit79A3_2067 [Nitrosomonas sp. Is79A3]